MARPPASAQVQVNFRMPADLKARIEAAAQENNRSTTAEIVAALSKAYPVSEDDFKALFLELEAQNSAIWSVIEPLFRRQQSLPQGDERAALTRELKPLFDKSAEISERLKELFASAPPRQPTSRRLSDAP